MFPVGTRLVNVCEPKPVDKKLERIYFYLKKAELKIIFVLTVIFPALKNFLIETLLIFFH